MKILITGGAGFIGYHLSSRLLADGHEVIVADNFSRGVQDSFLDELQANGKLTLMVVDLLNPDEIDRIGDDFDIIFHLAAIIGVQNVLNRPYDVLKNNVDLLTGIIGIARRQKLLKRLMFASTSEIYAGTLQFYDLPLPTPENTPLTITPLDHPRTSYMLSKIYGEALVRQSGVPYTIFRPHNFYGPRMGMSHVIPELLRKAFFNEGNGKLEVFSVEHKRTFCYIDDAVEMLVRLAMCDKAEGHAYNLGVESPETSIREVAETVLKVTGKDLEIEAKPPTPGSPERRCPSLEKTEAAIGYRAQVSLEEGVQRTFEWYRENIFLGDEICEK